VSAVLSIEALAKLEALREGWINSFLIKIFISFAKGLCFDNPFAIPANKRDDPFKTLCVASNRTHPPFVEWVSR